MYVLASSKKYALVLLLVVIEPRLKRSKSCLCESLQLIEHKLYCSPVGQSLWVAAPLRPALSLSPIPALRHRILSELLHLLSLFFRKIVPTNFATFFLVFFYYLTLNKHKYVLLMTSFLQLSPVRPVQTKRHFGFHHDLITTLQRPCRALTGYRRAFLPSLPSYLPSFLPRASYT